MSDHPEGPPGVQPTPDHLIPSVDQLRKPVTAVQDLIANLEEDPIHWTGKQFIATSDREDALLPKFLGVADALHAIDPQIELTAGWPHTPDVKRGLRSLATGFRALAHDWGWEPLMEPGPGRASYIKAQHDRFRDQVERPFYEAAIAGQNACRDCVWPSDIERPALVSCDIHGRPVEGPWGKGEGAVLDAIARLRALQFDEIARQGRERGYETDET
jgi:hypothetical protein